MFEASTSVIESLAAAHRDQKLDKSNEATTRLRIIDVILFEGLRWSREECIAEQPDEASVRGYLDYALVSEGQERLVVEAKRVSVTFAVPEEHANREYKIGTLVEFCGPRLQEVVEQAKRYAINRGIPHCVATNGYQWIVFPSFSPGASWPELKAVVFHSIDDIKRNWSTFYGLLSREDVTGGKLAAALNVKRPAAPRFARTYNSARGPDKGRPGNDLEKPFAALFQHSFDSITSLADGDALKQCYVSTESGNSYEREFAALLRRPVSQAVTEARAERARREDGPTEDLVSAIDDAANVIVLVGHIGSGKTTFVHHLLRIHLPKAHNHPVRWVIRDLIDDPSANAAALDAGQAERALFQALLSDLEERFPEIDPYDNNVLRGAFSRDLIRLAKGPRQAEFARDPDAKLRAEAELLQDLSRDPKLLAVAVLRHARQQSGHPVCVAFDNVDRGTPSYQQFVYALAHRLTRDAECTCIVTLRDTVFEIARDSGFLDTRNDRFFHLSPPSLHNVFSKRIKYSRALLTKNRIGSLARMPQVEIQRLEDYLEVINALILGDIEDTRRFMESASAGNIRKAFDFLRTFATSAHTDVGHLIQVYNEAHERQRSPRFEFREFLRPLALAHYYRFHGSHSHVVNLFEASPHRKVSHFHRMRILSYLAYRYGESQESARGETLVSELCAAMASCSHIESDTIQVCAELVRRNLVERLTSLTKPLDKSDVVTIGAAGYYYLDRLVFHEEYVYLVAQDTVIYDNNAFSSLERDFRSVETRKGPRKAVVEDFLRYLHGQESLERAVFGPPRPSLPWDRMFAAELGASIVGGSGWALQETPSTPAGVTPFKSIKPRQTSQLPLGITPETQVTTEQVAAVAKRMPELSARSETSGSTQLARILWALTLAQEAGLPPQNASDISLLIKQFGRVKVEGTNIARFFRTQGARFGALFLEVGSHRYALSSEGAALFADTFRSRPTA